MGVENYLFAFLHSDKMSLFERSEFDFYRC